jgi:hypothetical protein
MANSGMSEQDQLVGQTVGQWDPYRVTGKDFPNPGGSGVGPKPGHDELTKESMLQEMPRHNADDGPGESGAGTPSMWGKEGKGFEAMKNKGEGGMPATDVSSPLSVDLVSGKIGCAGYKPTPVDETPGPYVSIGR